MSEVTTRYQQQLVRELEDLQKQIASLEGEIAERKRARDALQATADETAALISHHSDFPKGSP